MQPEDIRKIRAPGSVSLSPDGRRVAFAVSRIEGSAYRSEIFIAATDGSGSPHRLTDGIADSGPRWSPDGASIAFLRLDAQGRRQLFVMPAAGGDARQLTDHPLGVCSPVTARHARASSAPVWSADSRNVAFTARVPSEASLRARVPFWRTARLRYRTDGSGYTVNTPSHAYLTDVASGETIQITHGEYEHWDVSWHDADTLLAATARHDDRDLDEAQDVVAIGLDGTVRQLTRTSTTVNLPTAAPDGSVYFVGIGNLGPDLNDARGRNV